MKNPLSYLSVFAAGICASMLLANPVLAGGQPRYIDSSGGAQSAVEEDDWTSHIDNQAYIEDYERRRRELRENSPPVIIIDRNRAYPYGYRECDSETVYVQSGNSTLIYRDGYRPNCYPHHVVVPIHRPVRPIPYIRNEKGKKVWSTGK